MSLFLISVSFNYAPFEPGNPALNLRQDASTPLIVPEWRRGVSVRPDDSIAAYALEGLRGRSLWIVAEFVNPNPTVAWIQIRAVSVTAEGGSPLLGDVAPRFVYFGTRLSSGPQLFELPRQMLSLIGVGSHVMRWRWEYRLSPSEPWQAFEQTQHRIYTTLRQPVSPWMRYPYSLLNTQLVWTDVLEQACKWASGAKTQVEAASRITRAVYELGDGLVSYDCPGYGATHYTRYTPAIVFECAEFLELLNGGFGNGPWVNCVDCAAITSTFANALGCQLWQSGMQSPAGQVFELRSILAIGSDTWQTACGWPGFAYHEVAWEGACTAAQNVYDACLMVNGNRQPSGQPPAPVLPTNMKFGFPGDGEYADLLCTHVGRTRCIPQPATTRRRRFVV